MTGLELLAHGWRWRSAAIVLVSSALALVVVRPRMGVPARASALGAVAVLLLALASPIEALARGTLFSAHMLQHLLLVLAAPPLALLALPRSRGHTPRTLPPLACWALGVGAMWIWHAPFLCDAAATSDGVRIIQNMSLLFMGAAFWWPIIGPQVDARLSDPAAVAYLFTACGACTVLGVAIAFSPVEVCSAYHHPADPLGVLPLVRGRWGLTPAVDQQLGGLLMWVPGCAVYASAILGVLGRYFSASPVDARSAS